MTYSVDFQPKAREELEKLPIEIVNRVVDKIVQAQGNPNHFLEKLKGMSEWKLRIGDYRVILLRDDTAKFLLIQAVGHRKNIYKIYKTE